MGEEEKEKDNLVYKDKETGTILYGFSNKDLRKIYIGLWILAIAFLAFTALFGFVVWKVHVHNIIGKILTALRS